METMSEDITLRNKTTTVRTMSGDINLDGCTGNVETMSGDITLKNHGGAHVLTMSGDIEINKGEIGRIESMSGDIDLSHVTCNKVLTMSGDLTIKDSEFNIVDCTELFGENSTIGQLYIKDSDYHIIQSSGFKWYNPFTWFDNNSIQFQSCGNNSNCIQINGDIIITNDRKYQDGKCLTKSSRPRIFILPDTIKVEFKVVFENGREDNILKSKHKVNVEHGKWEKL